MRNRAKAVPSQKMAPTLRQRVKLVHLLAGHHKDYKPIRDTVWIYLEDDRRRIRQVCRALNHAATRHVGQLFRTLFVRAPIPDKDTTAVRVVGPLCHHLNITVERRQASAGSQRSSSLYDRRHSEQRSLSRALWIRLLSSFHQLRTLTIRVHSNDSNWSMPMDVGETLVSLRTAVEQNRLPELKTLCLSPIHPMGFIYLCWSGFAAFGTTPAPSRVWKQLEILDLRIHSLLAAESVDDQDGLMLKKVLNNYLRSFSKSLRVLRVIWLGAEGPSPLTLHLEAGLQDRSPIQWPSLEELCVGNIYLPFQTVKLANQLAPSLSSLKMLRSTHREFGLAANASDSSAWMEVDLGGYMPGWKGRHSRASSVYSQSSEISSVGTVEDVSRSSRSILVYKDF